MKTFVTLLALLAVAVANPLPLVQIFVNIGGQTSIMEPGFPAIDRPTPESVVVVPEPVILPEPVLPGGVASEPAELPEAVLPEVVVPVPLPAPALPEVIVPVPVIAPENIN
ncbi:unnamed protein product [Parnassius apollo]|uniref:(apollo) hypothetical protein n=1 Tax=Parnassius apollo TaxID=110799 RepID=A0A8S3X9Q9_PARAO|nr:unnamed protein product [Parnassius apollo]